MPLGLGLQNPRPLSLDENHKSPGFWNSEVRDRDEKQHFSSTGMTDFYFLPHLNSD